MNGQMPLNPEIMAALSELLGGGNQSPDAMKPHTQNKVPHDVMQKMLKARMYELAPDAELDLEDSEY